MTLSDEQLRVVQSGGSVAVTAGAGTGKTHTLGHRYLHHLRQGMSPLEIVAVTFTDKAAAELRSRVRRYIGEFLPERPDALVEVEAAQISTIHALAARICRDHPEAAGVPPDFSLLEALDGPLWFGDQLEAALAALPDALFERVPYRRIAELLATLLEDPLGATAALACGPEGWPELVAAARDRALMELTAPLEWAEAEQTVLHARGAEGDLAESARRLAADGLGLLAAGEVAAGLAAIDRVDLRGGRQGAWPQGDLQLVKSALKVLREGVRAARKRGLIDLELGEADVELSALLPELRSAFELVQGKLATAKQRARTLDFGDLEVHALRALERPEVRAHYGERWRALLIDEQQDNSPAQEALLALLADGKTVTAVGDEKQGIYGFRGADVRVFRRARARIRQAGGSEVVLSRSFRCHASLLSGIDTTFAAVLADLHQPLSALRQTAPHPAPHLQVMAIEAERGVPKAQRQIAEARAIARVVAALIDARVPVHDPADDRLRPVVASDIAVLTRTWSPLDVYAEVLPGMGVPAVHSGGGDLLATREAKDGFALLRFLADPHDDLALAALLRSPLFALSDRSLYDFAGRLPRDDPPSWWDALQTQSVPEFAGAVQVLSILLRAGRDTPPSRLLALADRLCGYGAVLANLPGASRREADWAGFAALARTLEGGLGDCFGVVRRLRRLIAAGIEVPRPALEAGDAVTLMTVHRAKGLEWPVVFVADLTRSGRAREPDIRYDSALGVALRWNDPASGELRVPALFTLLEQQAAEAAEAEARRLHYVALTRARDRLVLSATEPSGGPLDLLLPGLDAAGVSCEIVPFDPADAVYPDAPIPGPAEGGLGDLWRRDPRDLPRLAPHIAPTLPPEDAAGSRGASDLAGGDTERWNTERWNAASLLLAEAYPDLLPLAEALSAAGVPPPDDDGFEVELTREGLPSGHFAPLAWLGPHGRIALVDAALSEGEFDQQLLRGDPLAPEGVVAALRAALEIEAM